MQMQHCQHLDTLCFRKKVHAIRKVPKKRTMHRGF